MDLVSELKGDLCIVTNALAKIKEDNDNSNNNNHNNEEALELHQSSARALLQQGALVALPNIGEQQQQHNTDQSQTEATPTENAMIEEMINAVEDIQFHNQTEP